MRDKSHLFGMLIGDSKNLEKQLWIEKFNTVEGRPYDFENNLVLPTSHECFLDYSDLEDIL